MNLATNKSVGREATRHSKHSRGLTLKREMASSATCRIELLGAQEAERKKKKTLRRGGTQHR